MRGLVLLVSLGLVACELELLQNELDVEDHGFTTEAEDIKKAMAVLTADKLLETEEDVEALIGKGSGGSRVYDFWDNRYCRQLFPNALASIAKFNFAACTNGNDSCEMRGKLIGKFHEMDGVIYFPCGNCLCAPNGGALSGTRYFYMIDEDKNFGAYKLRVSVGGFISVGLALMASDTNGGVNLEISFTGGVLVSVAGNGPTIQMTGTVVIGCYGGCSLSKITVTVKGIFVIGVIKFEVKVTLNDGGGWTLHDPLKNAAGAVLQTINEETAKALDNSPVPISTPAGGGGGGGGGGICVGSFCIR